ncbi:MAG: hypothetical protein ACLPTZ_10015, partial [Beijerinckiaceae bacterium]
TTDGREIMLTRYTHPEPELQLLIGRLKLRLPPQPPTKITSTQLSKPPAVVKTFWSKQLIYNPPPLQNRPNPRRRVSCRLPILALFGFRARPRRHARKMNLSHDTGRACPGHPRGTIRLGAGRCRLHHDQGIYAAIIMKFDR